MQICTISIWEICLPSVSQSFFFFSTIMPARYPRRRSLRDRLVWQECNARRGSRRHCRRHSDHTLSSLRSLDKWIIRPFLGRWNTRHTSHNMFTNLYSLYDDLKKKSRRSVKKKGAKKSNIPPLVTSDDNYPTHC